jgi:hypothetical protein
MVVLYPLESNLRNLHVGQTTSNDDSVSTPHHNTPLKSLSTLPPSTLDPATIILFAHGHTKPACLSNIDSAVTFTTRPRANCTGPMRQRHRSDETAAIDCASELASIPHPANASVGAIGSQWQTRLMSNCFAGRSEQRGGTLQSTLSMGTDHGSMSSTLSTS